MSDTPDRQQPAAPAGWHDDPEDSTQWRYWDGRMWTEHRAPKHRPAPPQPAADDKPTWRRLWPVAVIIIIAAVVSLVRPNPLSEFDRAVENGASCGHLFDLRNELHPRDDADAVAEANRKLRAVGCTSSTSERTDQ